MTVRIHFIILQYGTWFFFLYIRLVLKALRYDLTPDPASLSPLKVTYQLFKLWKCKSCRR